MKPDHPRIRGEHRTLADVHWRQVGSSPHTRGAQQRRICKTFSIRIIPAYAGSTPLTDSHFVGGGDHPRIRGEHQPPRVRDGEGAGIIPAYAGSTDWDGIMAKTKADHPRIRGEHLVGYPEGAFGGGSSPHTRGAPCWLGWIWNGISYHPRIRGEHLGLAVKPSDRERIIPAYAGSTIRPPSRSRRPEDHPRIRGEHASCCAEMLFAVGSSPHTRGAHAALDVEGLAARIIPAYAGSTVAEQCTHWVSSDHPRIRGEHA